MTTQTVQPSQMTKLELAEKIYKISHLTGNFRLRSGQTSHEYFDKYRFESSPLLLAEIARQLQHQIPPETQVLAGLEMGGIPIATALSLSVGLPLVFVRKKAKDYGTCQIAEGHKVSGHKVCMIEDVITTGGQVIESAQELRQLGAHVSHVLCVILRNEDAISKLAQAGLTITPLLTREELNPRHFNPTT